jgi:hypothetical protein
MKCPVLYFPNTPMVDGVEDRFMGFSELGAVALLILRLHYPFH